MKKGMLDYKKIGLLVFESEQRRAVERTSKGRGLMVAWEVNIRKGNIEPERNAACQICWFSFVSKREDVSNSSVTVSVGGGR